jgi:hypothetical protein
MSRFEETLIEGDPELRGETRKEIRQLQMVYRLEQVRQLEEQLRQVGLDPEEIEYYQAGWDKNLCPGTGMESENGILYNKRTGVSVPIVLDWACEWNCGLPQWRGQYEPKLETCKTQYFFTGLTEHIIGQLR